MSDILIIDRDSDRVVIGFIRDDGDYDYTVYTAQDGGILESPICDLGAVLAEEVGITEYQDYTLKEIE